MAAPFQGRRGDVSALPYLSNGAARVRTAPKLWRGLDTPWRCRARIAEAAVLHGSAGERPSSFRYSAARIRSAAAGLRDSPRRPPLGASVVALRSGGRVRRCVRTAPRPPGRRRRGTVHRSLDRECAFRTDPYRPNTRGAPSARVQGNGSHRPSARHGSLATERAELVERSRRGSPGGRASHPRHAGWPRRPRGG
jgi:hypothetical protein